MPHLRNLPPHAPLVEVFKAYPAHFLPLIEYHQLLLRGPSPFTVAERELIAAFVSATNACHYCAGVHDATAQAFGIDATLLAQLRDDLDAAPIAARLKPVLRYVRKLTLTPARLTPEDVAAFFAAGWDDRALHDAVAVCALFNCMNRLVEGFGIAADAAYFAVSAKRLASADGYGALKTILEQHAAAKP